MAQNKRVVAHVTLDTNLNVLSYSPELHQWSCLEPNVLTRLGLFNLFPQLESSKELIIESVQIPGNAFVYRYARFLLDGVSEQLFDLQIEAFPGVPDRLLLTIIPLTTVTTTDAGGHKDLAVLAHRNQELLLLNRASRILTATLNSAEVLERLLQVTVQIINAAGSSVWLWADAAEKHLVCRAAFHPGKDDRLIGLEVASGKGIVGWVAQSNEGTIVSDPANDARFYPHIDKRSGFLTTSLLAVPIHLRSHTLGVLEVVNKRDGRFTPKDLA
jgi:putative methionine-R-sulfoxide reductase with GAF domain